MKLELYEGHFEIRIPNIKGREMKLITQVPAPFLVSHFMQYNARSLRVQERHQEKIACLAKIFLASSDDTLSQL
jgi:hypothetical protein